MTEQFHAPVFGICSDNILHDKTDYAGESRLVSRESG